MRSSDTGASMDCTTCAIAEAGNFPAQPAQFA
jgi:hypothetical protein